ncbi:Crp/Fnr family transcriptional regulator [Zunongwangia sp. HGR-M22]|uniref:Crp/Fnr family transcriptional regulator n=1 Tax=Zunongwangia sp. HGR-M22 TaxID=3015168 RepID=UPI0022DD2218|nr:Crp/Fnr family transcriptional regulator [Zunongwangia sp. HGR-M22]WBL26980.1 Crp/Fnr family transcriptional regulator [Zunongwangia sp. HGR-M22]
MKTPEKTRCENCIIRQFNSLKAFSKEELKTISDNKVSREFKKGDQIFKEGEKLSGVFCVRDGASKLSKLSENGKHQIVKIAKKGEILGQRSVVSDEQTNLSATALNDTSMCYIPKQLIIDKINENPEFTRNLLKVMASDLRESDNFIVNMSQHNVKQRIAEALLYLEANFGTDDEGFLAVNLTREDLANVVGTATESCIRQVAELKKDNYISTKGKKTKIEDKKGFEDMISGF